MHDHAEVVSGVVFTVAHETVGTPSRTRTDTGLILSQLPLPLGYGGALVTQVERPRLGAPTSIGQYGTWTLPRSTRGQPKASHLLSDACATAGRVLFSRVVSYLAGFDLAASDLAVSSFVVPDLAASDLAVLVPRLLATPFQASWFRTPRRPVPAQLASGSATWRPYGTLGAGHAAGQAAPVRGA